MARTRTLEPKAKAVIVATIMENGEMETEEIMDLVRPHFQFDPETAKEQAIRRKAHQLAAQIRDEKGVRSVFACKVDGVSMYVNIDESHNAKNLRGVDAQLRMKYEGLKASCHKASKRVMEVEGQMSLDLTGSDEKEGMK